jgi:hypothetical protein
LVACVASVLQFRSGVVVVFLFLSKWWWWSDVLLVMVVLLLDYTISTSTTSLATPPVRYNLGSPLLFHVQWCC